MDPIAALNAADQAVSDGDLDGAADSLSAYRTWRVTGGFQPHHVPSGTMGDAFALSIQRRLDDALIQESSK